LRRKPKFVLEIIMRFLIVLFVFVSAPVLASPTTDADAAAVALAGTSGDWRGELQYRDYQSERWQGLPMTVTVAAQPDGVTTVRTAQYDDGPQTGIVTITTVTQIDSAASTASYAIFRKQRATDTGLSRVTAFTRGADSEHWTLVTIEARKDGNQMAQVRETTTRAGPEVIIQKDVNPDNDGRDEWLPRNRSLLTVNSGQ